VNSVPCHDHQSTHQRWGVGNGARASEMSGMGPDSLRCRDSQYCVAPSMYVCNLWGKDEDDSKIH
jgi:hypothetical protein